MHARFIHSLVRAIDMQTGVSVSFCNMCVCVYCIYILLLKQNIIIKTNNSQFGLRV